MNINGFLSLLILGITTSAFAFTNTSTSSNYQPPFYGVKVPSRMDLLVDYKFNPHHQILACKQESGNGVGTISFIYKDIKFIYELPAVLKDYRAFDGAYADPAGELTIKNEGYGSNQDILVSCEYKNM